MNDLITLTEAANSAPVLKGNRWYVTVARPGKGANGTYPEDVLKNTGPTALPAGTKAYFKHAKSEDRDPRDQVGVYKEGAFWNEEEGELGAYLTPFPRYAQVLEEAGDSIEASIHVAARNDGRGNVKELVFRRDNTVDLVAFAGLEGSGLKYQVESLFAAAAAEVEGNKENEMTFEITKDQWESFTSKVEAGFATFNTFVAESKVELQGVADDAAVEAAVEVRLAEALSSIAEVEKSIDDADIPAVVKESLKAAARKGEDIADNLAGAIAIVAETKKEITPDPKGGKRDTVVVVDESLRDDAPKNYNVGRWAARKAR